MAKKEKFALEMRGVEVRTIEELKENYDAKAILEYFYSGKLLTWLNDRYYDEEAEQVEELDKDLPDKELTVKLREIFEVEDPETAERRRARLEKLSEFTNDKEFTDNIDLVAFSQEELGELLDDEADTVYLCGESFRIPLSVENVRYIGVNSPVITIKCRGTINLSEKGIAIERCTFDEGTKAKLADNRCDAKLEKKEVPAKSDKDFTEIDPKPTVYEKVVETAHVGASAPVTEETKVSEDGNSYDDEYYADEDEYYDDGAYADDEEENEDEDVDTDKKASFCEPESDVGEGVWYSTSSENSIRTNPDNVSLTGLNGWMASGTFSDINDELSSQLLCTLYDVPNPMLISSRILENLEKRKRITDSNNISLITNFYNFTTPTRDRTAIFDAISSQSDITQEFISKTKVLPCNKYTIRALGGGSVFEVSDKFRQPFIISGFDIGEVRIYVPIDKWEEFYNKYVTPIIIIPGPDSVSEKTILSMAHGRSRSYLLNFYHIIEHIAIDMNKLISDNGGENSILSSPYHIFMPQVPWKCDDMKIDGFYRTSTVPSDNNMAAGLKGWYSLLKSIM